MDALGKRLEEVIDRLNLLEVLLGMLVDQRAVKDRYSVGEAARIPKKAPFTVREWCRLGRVNAEKRPCGRGRSQDWVIAHAELCRIQNEGLLPVPKH